MLVISAGMQKSGSAYIYNVINDLLVASGGVDAREMKERRNLQDELRWYNNNVGKLDNVLLLKLLLLSWKEGDFVVKTHERPTKLQRILSGLGFVKTIYIYRDPRDVLLSAQDHGKKIIEAGENHTFAKFVDFEAAFKRVKSWAKVFRVYKREAAYLTVRYEDLLQDGINTLSKICNYLKKNPSKEKIKSILDKYDRTNPNADRKGLHFNKAIAGRFREEMGKEELERFKQELGGIISEMGYEV